MPTAYIGFLLKPPRLLRPEPGQRRAAVAQEAEPWRAVVAIEPLSGAAAPLVPAQNRYATAGSQRQPCGARGCPRSHGCPRTAARGTVSAVAPMSEAAHPVEPWRSRGQGLHPGGKLDRIRVFNLFATWLRGALRISLHARHRRVFGHAGFVDARRGGAGVVVLLPAMTAAIALAHWYRAYRWHKRIQLTLGVVLLVNRLAAFEADMRINGWRERAEASPFSSHDGSTDWVALCWASTCASRSRRPCCGSW